MLCYVIEGGGKDDVVLLHVAIIRDLDKFGAEGMISTRSRNH